MLFAMSIVPVAALLAAPRITLQSPLFARSRVVVAVTREAHDRADSGAALLLGSTALLAVVEPASAADVGWIAPTKLVLGPLLTISTLFFLMRIVLSWFPKYDLQKLPWSVVALPTEPILKPTRQLVPPIAGVDISPIIWVSILSFFSEILLGPQGLLTIMERKAMM
jgi:YggT family protein